MELLELYRTMSLIRAFEEAAGRGFHDGRIRGPVHQYVGQEAIAVGVCANLRPTDYIASYHRGHGHAIAKGADIGKMMQRAPRTRRRHLRRQGRLDAHRRLLGRHARRERRGGRRGHHRGGRGAGGEAAARGSIVVAFFGDGAVNRGPLLEAFNWAVIYKLPVLFVCEDNQYAATVRTAEFTAGEGIVARAESFGIPAESIDGNDVALVFETTRRLLDRVRRGEPALIHALAYRWYGHFAHDSGAYRDPDSHRKGLEADPLARCRAMLLGNGVPDKALDEARSDAENRVARALAEAEAAPLPAARRSLPRHPGSGRRMEMTEWQR